MNETNEENIFQKQIKDTFNLCVEILKKYCYLDEKYYNLIALWILGTYYHNNFISFPYLYFNATKGSGKTRIENLISVLSRKGMLLTDMTESNLFRNAGNTTFCIDECENISSKEKSNLRLLLNSAYKKGVYVIRQKKNPRTNEMETEKFHMFSPVTMANIWGMDNTLSDRCITIILTKCSDKQITKRMEIFDIDTKIKRFIDDIGVVGVYNGWKINIERVYHIYDDYLNTTLLHSSPATLIDTKTQEKDTLFCKILFEFDFSGRNLELFFPLLYLAYKIDPTLNLFNQICLDSLEIIGKKEEEDFFENNDYMFLDYLNSFEDKEEERFISFKEILKGFQEYLFSEEERKKEYWLNSRWIGNAIKRLNIAKRKRRVRQGREVILDFKRIENLVTRFKIPLEPTETPQDKGLEAEGGIIKVGEET